MPSCESRSVEDRLQDPSTAYSQKPFGPGPTRLRPVSETGASATGVGRMWQLGHDQVTRRLFLRVTKGVALRRR